MNRYTLNNLRDKALQDKAKEARNETILCIVCGVVFAALSIGFFI